MIHKSSFIDSKAKISNNVKIGPFCFIGPNVTLNENVELVSNVHIEGNTNIGKGTKSKVPFPIYFRNYFTSISLGFFSSGTICSSSIVSIPFSSFAPLTTMSSASVNFRLNLR